MNLFKKRNRVKKIIKKPHKDGKCTGSLDPMLKNQNHSEEDMENGEKEGGRVEGSEEGERDYIFSSIPPPHPGGDVHPHPWRPASENPHSNKKEQDMVAHTCNPVLGM